MRLVRITGSGFAKTGSITDGHPVEFRHWQDVVDEAETELVAAANEETEEAVVELWLEDPTSFQENLENPQERAERVGMVHRADRVGAKYARQAPQEDWNQEYANAQAHARSVLANMGIRVKDREDLR